MVMRGEGGAKPIQGHKTNTRKNFQTILLTDHEGSFKTNRKVRMEGCFDTHNDSILVS